MARMMTFHIGCCIFSTCNEYARYFKIYNGVCKYYVYVCMHVCVFWKKQSFFFTFFFKCSYPPLKDGGCLHHSRESFIDAIDYICSSSVWNCESTEPWATHRRAVCLCVFGTLLIAKIKISTSSFVETLKVFARRLLLKMLQIGWRRTSQWNVKWMSLGLFKQKFVAFCSLRANYNKISTIYMQRRKNRPCLLKVTNDKIFFFLIFLSLYVYRS